MITITRQFALQLRNLLRRMGLQGRSSSHRVSVLYLASAEGLHVRAVNRTTALEYHQPGTFPPEQFALPIEALVACEGKRATPVTLERDPEGLISVQWEDRAVPQVRQYADCQDQIADSWPKRPERFGPNDTRLLEALTVAASVADKLVHARSAFEAVQLQGKTGHVVATDTHQALVIRGGFQFPWEDDVLVLPAQVFGFPDFPQDVPVEIGATDTHVFLRVRPWTMYLPRITGRKFPNVEQVCPPASAAKTHVQITGEDCEFLIRSLNGLPGREDDDSPVTVDCNGHIAIRAQGTGKTPLTELVLSRSRVTGEPVRFNTNRRYLHSALSLGFQDLHIVDPDTPLMFANEQRTYFWAGLGAEDALKPSRKCIRIDSASGMRVSLPQVNSPVETSNAHEERHESMKRTTTHNGQDHHDDHAESKGSVNGTAGTPANGQHESASTNGASRSAGPQDGTNQESAVLDPIAAAEALHSDLRTALASTSRLLQALRRNRKQARLVESTLQSLRQLQGV